MARMSEMTFKITGFETIHKIGKENLMNSAIDRYRREARRDKINRRFMRKLKNIFGDETEQVIEDLKSGKMTENIKLLAFNTLLDFQPVALSEMPVKYLEMPNGRIFYMLRTFTIKHLDIVRREAIWDMRYGETTSIKIQGYRMLIRIAGIFMLCNMGADEIKDFIFGRATNVTDRVIDNMFRLFGLHRYTMWYGQRYGWTEAMLKMFQPPINWLEAPVKDITRITKKLLADKRDEIKIKDLQTIKVIPVFGKAYYFWFGKGKEYEIEREIESMMERSENESFSDEEKSELFRMIDEREIRGEIKRSTATNKKKTFNINQRKIRYK